MVDIYLIALASCYLIALAIIDIRRGIIPNRWLFAGTLVSSAAVVLWSPEMRDPVFNVESHDFAAGLDAIAAMLAGFAVLEGFRLVSRGSMGAGDVKLAGVLGLILGLKALAPALMIGLGVGAAATLIRKRETPLAPTLALGAIVALIVRIYI